MTVGSLFAGIGGFDLGLERAGMTVRWQVEIDPFCRQVLAKHWPHVMRYEDVHYCHSEARAQMVMDDMADSGCGDAPSCPQTYYGLERVDVVCGGFPCQDISYAGRGDGIDGIRSGLWREMHRLVAELRPRIVLVENSAALTTRGLGRVLGDLAALGFDAEWSDLFACEMGCTHTRRRLFVVAYADRESGAQGLRGAVARAFRPLQVVHDSTGARARALARLEDPPALYGGADGVPNRMERNHGLGNAVCPDCAEWIGQRLMTALREVTKYS